MDASIAVIGGGAYVLLLFVLVGGPVLLVDRLRRRRQTAIERQIALTDAIDGQMGTIVSPVVTRPLFGGWEIRIAVPFHRSATVAGILSVVDDVFKDAEGAGGRSYRVFLTAWPDIVREKLPPRSKKRWARDSVAAA